MNEDDLIRWLKSRAQGLGGERIGDDAAILPAGGPWVTTVDCQIENVHFFSGTDPSRVARRLLAVNLSDLAAMGAEPAYGFLALSAPSSYDFKRFFEGFLAGCSAYGVELSGGDLSTQPTVTAALTLIGKLSEGGRFLERGAALPGHRLWLGGAVGLSAAGLALVRRGAFLRRDDPEQDNPGDCTDLTALGPMSPAADATARHCVSRHLSPKPQLELGRWLASQPQGAAIDVSDGLAKDLHRLCRASGVGAELRMDALPAPDGWSELEAYVGEPWRRLAIGGGEDSVLCFTLPPTADPPAAFGARPVGEIRAGSEVILREADQVSELPPEGWDHLEKRR